MKIKFTDANEDLVLTKDGKEYKVIEFFDSLKNDSYNAVDLGLPSGIKWADCNVGADNPEDPGLYFQWGDNEGFSKDSGKYCNGTRVAERNWTGDYSATHGCMLGNSDNIPADPYFDAARKHMGAPWRMPTTQEIQELFNDSYTTHQWTTRNGMNGYLVTSKSNDNSIFLPAAGYFDEGFDEFGYNGHYWSSSFLDEESAFSLSFSSGAVSPGDNLLRCVGFSVRAVYEDGIDLGLPSGTKWAACNLGATTPWDNGLYFSWGNVTGHTGTDGYSFDSTTYNSTPGKTLTGDIPANATYDAAYAIKGSGWRIPTKAEIQELVNNCTHEETSVNGVTGMLFRSKINGNRIFFPYAGCIEDSYHVSSDFYISSSSANGANYAYGLQSDLGEYFINDTEDRYAGWSIRPVQNLS